MANNPGHDQSDELWSLPNWPPRLEKIFVDSLIEEMKYVPDKIPSSFNDLSWDRVVKDFHEYGGVDYDKAELKKHLGVLRKRFRIVKPLYNHGGFGWDYHRKMVDVDDGIWAEYTEVHPEIKPYRKYGCPIYDELCEIFTRPKATGKYAMAVGGYRLQSSNVSCPSNSNGSNKRQLAESQSSGPNKRSNTGSDGSGAATSIMNPAGSGSNSAGAAAQGHEPSSANCCLSILNGMQGVDGRLYEAALDLFNEPTWREVFVGLKVEKRLGWLKAMLPRA